MSKSSEPVCVFCAKFDSEPEGNQVMSFEPLNPVTPGHRLFIHRKHTKDFGENTEITARVMREAAWYAQDLPSANIITSKGKYATQTVFHFHVHVVPRRKDDGLMLPWSAALEALPNQQTTGRQSTPAANPEPVESLEEQLAAIEHERWASWQEWVHKQTLPIKSVRDGQVEGYLIPYDAYHAWERQINTPYEELSKREKDSDREQVARYWPLVEAYLEREKQKARIDELITVRILTQALKSRSNSDLVRDMNTALDWVLEDIERRLKELRG